MAKSSRLLAVLLELQSRRQFTAQQLAEELGVSRRTALRYLHELSEAGVPLAARPGPGGGYLVVRDRTLPPLAFSVDEAVSLFFAYESLQGYGSLPFEAEFASVLGKLRQHLPTDAQHRIDRLRGRIDFVVRRVDRKAPHLKVLLEAALDQAVVRIEYQSLRGLEERVIQPVGVYAHEGLWYCPAYCFSKNAMRLFRVDHVSEVERLKGQPWPRKDIAELTLSDYYDHVRNRAEKTVLEVDLTPAGLRRLEPMAGNVAQTLDGGHLSMEIETANIEFFARMFLGMGTDARVRAPEALVSRMREILQRQMALYDLRREEAVDPVR